MRGVLIIAGVVLCAACLANQPTTINRNIPAKPAVQGHLSFSSFRPEVPIAAGVTPDNHKNPALAAARSGIAAGQRSSRQGGDNCTDATVIPGLPFSDCGSTDGYQHDYTPTCTSWAEAPDVMYAFTPEADIVVNVSLCNGTTFDSVLSVLEDCGAEIACNDDSCGLQSEIKQLPLAAGRTYYIVVAGYGTSSGPYTLDVWEWTPCAVDCPPNATVDPEPICYDGFVDVWNGGCGVDPPVFEPIADGETICGTAGTYVTDGGQYRDTDWFEITVDAPMQFTFTVEAEFTVAFGLPEQIDLGVPGCENLHPWLYPSATVGECTPYSVTTECMPPGTYYFVVAPNDFTGVPCGARYTASLTCTPCVIPLGACCLPSGECLADIRESLCIYKVGQWQYGVPCEQANCPSCKVDASLTADPSTSVSYYGNTLGAGNDCVWRVSEDEMIEIYIPIDGTWRFQACGLGWDTYEMLFRECCYDEVAEYGLTGCSVLETPLTTGTYYLLIDASDGYAAGVYELTVDFEAPGACCLPGGDCTADVTEVDCATAFGEWQGAYQPCTPNLCQACAVCPQEGMYSPEPACYDEFMDMWNGGCNYIPNTFGQVTCGETICGDAGTFIFTMPWGPMQLRDMDWYQLDLSESAVVSVTATAQFPLLLGQAQQIVRGVPGCDNITGLFEVSTHADPCRESQIASEPLPPGTYYFIATPTQYEGVPCGSAYTIRFDCTPVVIPTGACCTPDTTCVADLMEYECLLLDGYWQGPDTACESTICEPCGTCPDGATVDPEPACYDEWVDVWNGGCNYYPNVFQPIECGETICGTSGNYIFTDPVLGPDYYRDTDWFEIHTDVPTAFQLDATTSFPMIFGLVEQRTPGIPGCDNITGSIKPNIYNPTCVPATLVLDCMPPGTYYFWVSTQAWEGTSCGSPYSLMVTCSACDIPAGACCLLAGTCLADQAEADCLSASGYWQGEGVDCQAADCAVLHPTNDRCEEAQCVTAGTTYGSNQYASGRDVTSCTTDDWADVWWVYTPTVSETVTIDTFGSDFDTTLAVYAYPCSGDELACNNDALGHGVQSQLELPMVAGNSYLIRVAGNHGAQGSIVLNVSGGAGVCAARGDLNCDGAINVFDIDAFVLALTDPAGYTAAYPACSSALADVNGDGLVNVFDIDPFVGLLVGN